MMRLFITLLSFCAVTFSAADLHSFSKAKQAAVDGVVRFTYDSTNSIDPEVTSTLGDSEFRWTKPSGDKFYGKTPAASNFDEVGTYVLWCSDWSQLENLYAQNDAALTKFDIGYRNLRPLISLDRLYLYNTSVEGDISGWTLPANLDLLYLYNTSVEGDISGWTLPANLDYLLLFDTSVFGDISGWILPASLDLLYLYNTSVEGDISGWTLPANLDLLYLHNTSVEGDISGWILPASLDRLYLHNTSVEGDISGWTLPANLDQLYLYNTSVEGDISGWVCPIAANYIRLYNTALDYDSAGGCWTNTPTGIKEIRMDGCTLTSNQVDYVLQDCDTSGVTNSGDSITLNLGGDNDAPTSTGLNSYSNLVDKGWTVTIN